MEESTTKQKIYSAGYSLSAAASSGEVNRQFAAFHEKEPEGTVGASNLYILAEGASESWHPEVTASFITKKVLYEYFRNPDFIDANKLALAIRGANNELFEYSTVQNHDMGGMILAAAITDGKVVIANVGFGNAYIIRNSKVFQITEDPNVLDEKVKNGELSKEEAYGNGDSEHSTSVIGREKDIIIDIYDGIEVKENDVLILCSHSLNTYISKQELLQAAEESTPREISEQLLQVCTSKKNSAEASVAAIKIFNENEIASVARCAGAELEDTDLNKESKNAEFMAQKTNRRQDRAGKKNQTDKLPLIIIGSLLSLLMAAGIFWVITAKSGTSNLFGPDFTATATIDFVRETVSSIEQTIQVQQIAAVQQTVANWPTQTPLPTFTPVYIDLGNQQNNAGETPAGTDTNPQNSSSGNVNGLENIPTIIPISSTPETVMKENIVSDTDGSDMVYVPAGDFLLGSDPNVDPYTLTEEETPQQEIYLSAYWIDQNEITNTRYRKCVEAGVCEQNAYMMINNPAYDNYPVTYVTHDQAAAYCNWAGKRLPTEFEWEKAARGEDGRIYPWGNEEPTYDSQTANIPLYEDTEAGLQSGLFPVGSFPNGASPYGAFDMAGNVWEWTDTWFSDGTYSQLSSEAEESGTTISNPKGPTDGSIYVIRGGSASSAEVNYYLSYLRSANRGYVNMSSSYFIGFRCVMEDNQ